MDLLLVTFRCAAQVRLAAQVRAAARAESTSARLGRIRFCGGVLRSGGGDSRRLMTREQARLLADCFLPD